MQITCFEIFEKEYMFMGWIWIFMVWIWIFTNFQLPALLRDLWAEGAEQVFPLYSSIPEYSEYWYSQPKVFWNTRYSASLENNSNWFDLYLYHLVWWHGYYERFYFTSFSPLDCSCQFSCEQTLWPAPEGRIAYFVPIIPTFYAMFHKKKGMFFSLRLWNKFLKLVPYLEACATIFTGYSEIFPS